MNRWRWAWLALAIFAASAVAPAQQTADTLRIVQLDVGQGDAALITTPEGRHVLIDAGRRSNDVAYWLSQFVDTLALVIASHAHADHIGGMAMVLATVPVKAYVDNGVPHTTATYRRTMAAVGTAAQSGRTQYYEATPRTFTVGSTTFRILPPARVDASHNNNSVGVIVTHGEFRALFTGDSETEQLEHWLATDTIPQVHVLKAAHHGAANGFTPEWAYATSPELVLVPVGRNSYGHPSPWVERAWASMGATVLRTDISGTIEVNATADGHFTVRTDR